MAPNLAWKANGLKECNPPECGKRERVSSEGECVPCEDYTILDGDKKNCVEPTCGNHMIILPDGSCQKCDDGTRLSTDKKSCIEPTCEPRVKIANEGSCDLCTEGDPTCKQLECFDKETIFNTENICLDLDLVKQRKYEDLVL